MKHSFIFFTCLLNIVMLQMNSLSAHDGRSEAMKKIEWNLENQSSLPLSFGGGCGCGKKGGNQGNNLPPGIV